MQAPHRYIIVASKHCIAVDLSKEGFVYESDPHINFNYGIPFKYMKGSEASEVSKYYTTKLHMDLPNSIQELWRVDI